MLKRSIDIILDTRGGVDVKGDFIQLHGGSKVNWDWLERMLERMAPVDLKHRCVRLIDKPNPCDLLELRPCFVFGVLDIPSDVAWRRGLLRGTFLIEAVVHEDQAEAYFTDRFSRIPPGEQDV